MSLFSFFFKMIDQNQNGIRINLEFGLIVAMALLILSFQFYTQNKETINKIIYDVFYWIII